MPSMRERMPTCAGWIDELREVFGTDEVNTWMREGLKAGSFYAAEAGQVVGAEPSREGYVQAYMPPIEQPKAGSRRGG